MTQLAIPNEPSVLCERCRSKPAVHTHHRKRRSQGGDDSPENTTRVCLDCHVWIHDNPRDAAAAGWLVMSWQEPIDVDYQIPDPPPIVIELRDHEHVDLEPGEACPTCGRKKPMPRQPARNRTTVSMKVPLDKQENGAELWDELMDIGRELLCARLGWEENVPTYNVAMVLVAQGLEVVRGESFNPVPGHRLTEALDDAK